MKSEKLDLNSVNQSDFGAVAKAVENSLPKDAILLDKHLLPSRLLSMRRMQIISSIQQFLLVY